MTDRTRVAIERDNPRNRLDSVQPLLVSRAFSHSCPGPAGNGSLFLGLECS